MHCVDSGLCKEIPPFEERVLANGCCVVVRMIVVVVAAVMVLVFLVVAYLAALFTPDIFEKPEGIILIAQKPKDKRHDSVPQRMHTFTYTFV